MSLIRDIKLFYRIILSKVIPFIGILAKIVNLFFHR